jgi:LacI family transcriptional regulator
MALSSPGKRARIRRATIRDVARVARVSHETVSRLINGGDRIAPATRSRVEHAIAKLGFRPNHIARSLVSRWTKTVALVVGDVGSPFFPDVARGVEDELSPAG